jgi:cell division protein FtsQ
MTALASSWKRKCRLSGNRKAIKGSKSQVSCLVRVAAWVAPGLMILVVLGGIAYWFGRDLPYFHVAAVRVYGTDRVTQQDLVQLAQIQRGVSLLRLDVDEVRTRVMQHPWIRDALVHRLYPNELEVIVYERRPTAILESGNSYVVDGAGYVLGKLGSKEGAGLPRLVMPRSLSLTPGQQIQEPAVVAGLQLLHQVQESPFFRQAAITHVEVLSPERFVIDTRRGKLVVGANIMAAAAKLEFFLALDDVLRTSAPRFEYVDLSMGNQIVVKTSARTTPNAGRLQRRGGGNGQAQ